MKNDLISRQALCEYALNQKDKSITPNDIMRFPAAQPETHKERTETHACDLIDRQAAIDIVVFECGKWTGLAKEICKQIKQLPTTQPERKKGKWIDGVLPNNNGGLPVQICDQCNTFFPLAYTGGGHHFCPNCGARMEDE